MPTIALALHVTGIVQGVGFRPFVYNLAVDHGLTGWVLNASDGVHCVVEGEPGAVDAFPGLLRSLAPRMAVVEQVVAQAVEPEGFLAFEIRESHDEAGAMTLVSPDIATCPECLDELNDPADRRHGYPFTNCTNCGPRFTIIAGVPYDRPATTMRDFPMCEECAAEYADPSDRRFHAQPNACFRCGPRLYLNLAGGADPGASVLGHVLGGGPRRDERDASIPPPRLRNLRAEAPGSAAQEVLQNMSLEWAPDVETVPRPHRDPVLERARAEEILDAVVGLLRDGAIVALKGLGGFHLACDAMNTAAVETLRERKHRWGKPLAIMVRDLETAEALCHVDENERELLTGTARPVVLLRRRPSAVAGVPVLGQVLGGGPRRDEHSVFDTPPRLRNLRADTPATPVLAPGVADGLAEIGVMLPYTPLHHLLLAKMGTPLVMTSGNLSDEPIATDNAEALSRLGGIADAFLLHDRAIRSRYDDSVVRVVDGLVEPVRRARGYAPHPLALAFTSDTHILAVGPEQKNTFTLLKDGYAFVSQHIGDLENAETLQSFEETLALYRNLFRIEPHLIAHDLHPEYLSTKWALGSDLPRIGVQHHHAHIASVTGEHGVSGRVVGIAFDGTGYGTDGRIWGGEVLLADWDCFERAAHLRYVPMPGGAAAVKRPARMAVGTLSALGLLEHPGAAALRSRLADGEERTLLAMIEHGLNCPLTSSMGRLFDTVAAIIGVADDARYEGEAAILLEASVDPAVEGTYRFRYAEPSSPGEPLVIDPTPVLEAVLDDVVNRTSIGGIAARFHRGVQDCIVRTSERFTEQAGTRNVALSGGVFMNRIVLGGAIRGLRDAGLEPLTHRRLPVNDAAVSFGQAIIAWAGRHGA